MRVFTGINPFRKKTHLQYSVMTLSDELSAPAEATNVEFSAFAWKLNCQLTGDFTSAADYYKRAIPFAGYQALPGEVPQSTYWNLRLGMDAGDVIMVQLSGKDGQNTRVSIIGVSASVMKETKKRQERQKDSAAPPGF